MHIVVGLLTESPRYLAADCVALVRAESEVIKINSRLVSGGL